MQRIAEKPLCCAKSEDCPTHKRGCIGGFRPAFFSPTCPKRAIAPIFSWQRGGNCGINRFVDICEIWFSKEPDLGRFSYKEELNSAKYRVVLGSHRVGRSGKLSVGCFV